MSTDVCHWCSLQITKRFHIPQRTRWMRSVKPRGKWSATGDESGAFEVRIVVGGIDEGVNRLTVADTGLCSISMPS